MTKLKKFLTAKLLLDKIVINWRLKQHDKLVFFNLLNFILLGIAFIFSIFPITDNDVWWHLKTGEYIWQNTNIPSKDIFSYTIYNQPWIAFEWLAQVILYIVYLWTGLAGITIFKAVIVVLIFFIMQNILPKQYKYKNVLIKFSIFILAFIVMRDGLRERPQLFTYLFCSIYMYIFVKKIQLIWFIPFLQLIWVNMHGPSAIIGLGVTLIYILFSKKIKINVILKFCFVLSVFFVMFINPNTYKIFYYFYTFFNQHFNKLILEYQSPAMTVQFIPYFLMLFIALMSLFLKFKEDVDGEINTKVLVISFSICGSLLAIRNIPVFVILTVPFILYSLSNIRVSYKVNFLNIILIFVFLLFLFDSNEKYMFGFGDKHKSRYAVEFVKQCRLKGKIFNDYDFGGYMIWKLYPSTKVFIDGRLVEYGSEFVKKSFYFWQPEIWNDFEKKYNFTSAIIPLENYYNSRIFDQLEDWVLVYWDDNAMVYLKDVPENKKIINIFGYKILKPGSPYQAYLNLFSKQKILNEINRTLYFAPQCIKARIIKKYILLS